MARVELPASDIKDLGALGRRQQQVKKAGHRAVVQVRRRRPDAVERPRAIGENPAKLILPSFVNLVFRLSVGGRLVLPLLDDATGHGFGSIEVRNAGGTPDLLE